MLLEGPNIQDQLDRTKFQQNAGLTIAQLLVFNCVQHASLKGRVRHNKSQETPVPIYVGLKLHSVTRKRELVDRLHSLGLSIPRNNLAMFSKPGER